MDIILEFFSSLLVIFQTNPLAQAIGFLAFFVSAYNFLFCKDKKFIIVTAIASLVWGLHFLSLGLISAGLVNMFDVGKNLISLKYERNIKWVLWITLVYIVIGILSYDGLLSVIPTLTGILSTYLVFYVRGVYLNLGFLGIIWLWVIYNYLNTSIGWVMTDVFLFFFWISGILRIIKENKQNNLKKS